MGWDNTIFYDLHASPDEERGGSWCIWFGGEDSGHMKSVSGTGQEHENLEAIKI